MILRPGAVLFGRDSRSKEPVIVAAQERGHLHCVGCSGQGKTVGMVNFALQDILQADGQRRGLTLLDPHRSGYDRMLAFIAEYRLHRYRRIHLLDPSSADHSFSLNPFRALQTFHPAVLASILTTAILHTMGVHVVTDRPLTAETFEQLFIALGVLGLPLVDAADFLYVSSDRLRGHHLERLSELAPDCYYFWSDVYRMKSRIEDYLGPVRRKLHLLLTVPATRRIFSQPQNAIDLAEAMDNGDIILVNLRQSEHLDFEMSRLLGTLLTIEYYTSCFRRKNVTAPHFLYIDECQRFLTPDIARILDESRKFGLFLQLFHQHLGHLREAGEHIYRSIMTNCRTKLVFGGLDPTDTEELARLLWAGRFNLQRAMPKHYRMAAVGNERVQLTQASQTHGTTAATGQTWSRGTAIAQSSATTSGRATAVARSRTISAAETESESETDQWSTTRARSHGRSVGSAVVRGSGESAGASMAPDGLFLPGETIGLHASHSESTAVAESVSEVESESVAETEGGASTTGRARTRGTAQSKGTTASRSIAHTTGRTSTATSQQGGSRTSGVNHGTTQGWSEAVVARYERVAGSLYSLADQVHMKSVSLANTSVGVAWLKVGAGRPRRIDIPYLKPSTLSAERIERVRRQLLAASPYTRSAAEIDAAYLTHRQQLMLAATTALTPPTIEATAEDDDVEWR